MKILQLFIFLLLFVFSIRGLYSQTDTVQSLVERYQLNHENLKFEESLSQMEIFSASRSAKKLEDLPVTVYIITREEIINNGYITLADVLKSLPAIRVSQPGSGESGEMFLLRGLKGNEYTKILINDIPVQPSVLGGIPIGAQLPIQQAERIEVIYGSASSVYGADATNGVINIITKKPNENNFAHATGSLGDNGYTTANFMVGGKAGRDKHIMEYSIYGSLTNIKNLNIYHEDAFNPTNAFHIDYDTLPFYNVAIDDFNSDFLNELGISEDSIISYFFPQNYDGDLFDPDVSNIPHESHLFGFRLAYKGLSLNYNNMYRQDHSSLGYTTYLYKYNNPLNYIAESIQQLNLSYDKDFKFFSSSTKLTYLKYEMDPNSSFGPTYVNVDNWYVYSRSDDIIFDQMFNFNVFKGVEILSGVNLQYSGSLPLTNGNFTPFDTEDYSIFQETTLPEDPVFGSFGLNPNTFYNLGAYVQSFYDYNKVSIMAGARYDRNSNYGNAMNPRFAALYKVSSKSIFRLASGIAYKAPSPNQMYYSIAHPSHLDENEITYEYMPNEDLEPERFNSHEIGFRQFFSKNVYIDLSAYVNLISNLMTTSFDKHESGQIVRINFNEEKAKGRLYGFQARINADNILPTIMLNTEINLNLSRGEETLPNRDVIETFRNNPAFVGQINLDFSPIPNLKVKIDNLMMSSWYREYIPDAGFFERDFAEIDGYMNTDLMLNYSLNKQFQIYFKVLNVFDAEYGGIDVTGTDVDMIYNPQLKRNIRFGLIYRYN